MGYSIQAIIAARRTFPVALPSDRVVLDLDGGMQMVPLGGLAREIHGIPFLPLTDDGEVELPSALQTLCARLGAHGPVAYIEAELFGGGGTQAHALFPAPGIDAVIRIADDAINQALGWLGVTAGDGKDEFTTAGLGKYRDTDAWLSEALTISPAPRMAKAHSLTRVEKLVALGWTVEHEIKAENGDICEWVLYWKQDSDPIRPR